eukprot:295447_1
MTSQNLLVSAECNGSISECDYFTHLLGVMDGSDLETINIDDILNNYLHLVYEHDDDKDFELIHNKINARNCNILNCNIFMRNHRNRNKTNLSHLFHSNDDQVILEKQILDKIHCHYAHCFDIGHRLTVHEKANAKNISSLTKLLKNKHKTYREIHQKLARSTISKFVTIIENENKEDYKQNENDNLNQYNFGVKFYYVDAAHAEDDYGRGVRKKYKSFKEELITNKIMTINLCQFNSELKKAGKYFNSYYCQKVIINQNQKENEMFREKNKLKPYHIEITVEHILSVLIYSNYDILQYEFTKTYRPIHQNESHESICKRHEEFYFLGNYLNQTVHRLGKNIHKGTIKSFYHGITEKLLFSLQKGAKIESPLSTSSSMEVAINFTANKGLLVEFGCDVMNAIGLSVAWCSDFPNEREHLFIQSGAGLKFVNITDVKNDFDFDCILEAIHILNSLDVIDEHYSDRKGEIAARLIKQETDTETWDSLNIYAKKLFHLYCSEITFLQINWKEMESKYSGIHQVLKTEKFNVIDFGLLGSLYPNLEEVYVSYMNLCVFLLDDIVNHLQLSKIDELIIYYPDEHLGMSIDDVLKTYEKKFSQIGFDIDKGVNSDSEAWLVMNRK